MGELWSNAVTLISKYFGSGAPRFDHTLCNSGKLYLYTYICLGRAIINENRMPFLWNAVVTGVLFNLHGKYICRSPETHFWRSTERRKQEFQKHSCANYLIQTSPNGGYYTSCCIQTLIIKSSRGTISYAIQGFVLIMKRRMKNETH